MKQNQSSEKTLCPSARPELPNSIIFGVIGGTVDKPKVNYLKKAQPVTEELLKLTSPVTPAEVFRAANSCATNQCQHFDGNNCRLAQRVVEKLPIAAEQLSPCAIRKNCRWFQQEGKAACLRCPQIITDTYNASELIREVSMPTTIGE